MIDNTLVEFRDTHTISIWDFANSTSKSNLNKRLGKDSTLIKALNIYWVYCQNCKIYKAVIVHHIDKDRKNHKIENLLLVCKICHIKLHHPNRYHPKRHDITKYRKSIIARKNKRKAIKERQEQIEYFKLELERLNNIIKKNSR